MDWKFYLTFAAGPLELVSKLLASKDANTTGADDKAAAFLHYASLGIRAIINDQDVPPLPAPLAAQLVAPGTKINA